MSNKPKVIAVVGPTASGKTSLSIELAKQINGEVVSADSRQVYRGLDIGTGKVTTEEMAGIPHHLLDIADPSDTYTGFDFVRDATEAIDDILARGKVPIVAGGSFFWLDLLRGKQTSAPVEPNPELRNELELLSTEELVERLRDADPERAATIDINNRRRLIRALEIADSLGTVPIPPSTESNYNWCIIGIDIDKEVLHENIHQRLLTRLQDGMLEEARSLHEHGLSFQRMDELGLEYRYLAKHLSGEMDYETMVATLETKIKQFAKRQLTWLKRDQDIAWFAPEDRIAIFRQVADFLGEA